MNVVTPGPLACERHYRVVASADTPLLIRTSAYRVPPTTSEDYARLAACAPTDRHPVLLDHAQYFDFLAHLVQALWQSLGETTRVFVRLRAPYIEALPSELLDARVVLGTGLDGEMPFWSRHSSSALVALADHIRRDLDQPGDNTLSCSAPDTHCLAGMDRALIRNWPRHAVRVEAVDTPVPAGLRAGS